MKLRIPLLITLAIFLVCSSAYGLAGYSYSKLTVGTGGLFLKAGDLTVKNGGSSNVFTVDATQGNTVIAGTCTITGLTTLLGNLAVTGSQTFGATALTGLLSANGGITVDSGAFAVADTTGKITGGASADIALNTNMFTVDATQGNTIIAGSLTSNGGISCDSGAFAVADLTGAISGGAGCDITLNTNMFTVDATQGNTVIAGTCSTGGLMTASAGLKVGTGYAGGTGATIESAAGNINTRGNLTVDLVSTLTGAVDCGSTLGIAGVTTCTGGAHFGTTYALGGCTIYNDGKISTGKAVTFDTTCDIGGILTCIATSKFTGGLLAGTGYSGGTGSTLFANGNISATGTILADTGITSSGALTGLSAVIGGGYGAAGCTIASDGNVTTNGTILTDSSLTAGKTGSNGAVYVKSTGAGATTIELTGSTGNVVAVSTDIGGGYSSTGTTIATDGAITCASTILADSTITSGKTGSNGGLSVRSTGAGAQTFGVAGATGNITGSGTLALSGATSGGITLAPIAVGTDVTTIQNQNVAAAVITLPSATCTLPGLSLANIWSANQELDSGITVDDTNFIVDGGTGAVTTASSITALSAAIGGGYSSTGVDISSAGVIQATGAITSGAAGSTIGSFTANGSTSGSIVVAPIAVGTGPTTLINQAGTINVTLPSATCTLPGLGLANIWTANQELDSGFTVDDTAFAVADTTGVLTLINGATIDNNATATILNLTEDTIRATGAFNVTGKTTLGSAATSTNCLLLGAGAPSGSEATTSVANSNFVDFRCASTAINGWAHAGAFYMKAQHAGLSASALRGYAYADAPSGASTGEVSGVYGIGEQHGVGTISATGKLMGLRGRITVPTGLTLTAGNYYGLVIDTDLLSSVANCTDSAYIKFDDPNARGNWLKYALEIANGDVGTATSNMVKTDLGDTATVAGLKVKINNTTYWIQLSAYSP